MKRILLLPVLMLALAGCSAGNGEMEAALELRGRCLGAQSICFRAQIAADYIDSVEEFALDCTVDSDGAVSFSVSSPEDISGITGQVRDRQGALTFDDEILAFPLMADERLSPIAAPWLMIKALRSGYISACVQEGEKLHITVDDSYADDALTLEIWAAEGSVEAAEIAWKGRRSLSMEIEDFTIG